MFSLMEKPVVGEERRNGNMERIIEYIVSFLTSVFVMCTQCRGDTCQHLPGPFHPNCFVTSPADGQKGSALFEWVGAITPYGCRVVNMLSEERRIPHHLLALREDGASMSTGCRGAVALADEGAEVLVYLLLCVTFLDECGIQFSGRQQKSRNASACNRVSMELACDNSILASG